MSTRSYIGILTDNQVKYVYCHHDGYVEGVGAELLAHFADRDKVLELVNMGDTSWVEHGESGAYNDGHGPYEESEEKYRQDDDVMMEYIYLFKDGRWYFRKHNGHEWKDLREYLIEAGYKEQEDGSWTRRPNS